MSKLDETNISVKLHELKKLLVLESNFSCNLLNGQLKLMQNFNFSFFRLGFYIFRILIKFPNKI
jgi:hypothetical protein